MLSVVIPTLNAGERLAQCLTALVPAAVEGLVRDVVVVDGGSTDGTLHIVDAAGADLIASEPGRGRQLALGARKAKQPWLLFLHADTVLSHGWDEEVARFMEAVDGDRRSLSAASFRFALDDVGAAPRVLERLVALRNLAGLPYGDQGLLIPRRLYDAVGGYAPVPIMEDVMLARRLGRRRIARLRALAVTGAERYQSAGYPARVLRNQYCLALHAMGAKPERILAAYKGGRSRGSEAEAARPDGQIRST
ncbi:MAG: TIGR04283 family arsenosugar biosynthesis glycosyltransferase [Hyphomicrobiaceae bacterium]